MKDKGKKGDDDEGESPFMPLEEVFRKLKSGPLNFGMYQTGDKDNPILLAAHKRKNPEFLGKQAKKEAGTSKGSFGTLTLESGVLRFECETDKVPKSLQKKLRVMLKANGFTKYKPQLMLPGGVELGETDDEDDDEDTEDLQAVVAPGGSATATRKGGAAPADDAAEKEDPAAAKEKAEATAALQEIGPKLQELAQGEDEKAKEQAEKLLKLFANAVEKSDWKKIQATVKVAAKLVKAGGVETAEKKEQAAEGEADAGEDSANGQADEARGKVGEIADQLSDVRGSLDELESRLDATLAVAEKLAEEDSAGKKPDDWDDRLKGTRKAAEAMLVDLKALDKDISKVERSVTDTKEQVKEIQAQEKRVVAMRASLDKLHKAVEEAEAIEEEVDAAIEASGTN